MIRTDREGIWLTWLRILTRRKRRYFLTVLTTNPSKATLSSTRTKSVMIVVSRSVYNCEGELQIAQSIIIRKGNINRCTYSHTNSATLQLRSKVKQMKVSSGLEKERLSKKYTSLPVHIPIPVHFTSAVVAKKVIAAMSSNIDVSTRSAIRTQQ